MAKDSSIFGWHLLAFHRQDVHFTLNTTFLNTNVFQDVLRNLREATGNVKRWNEKEDTGRGWMASGLLWPEAGFRKVQGREDLHHLAPALPRNGAARPTPRQAAASLTARAPLESEAHSTLNTEAKIHPASRHQF